MDGEGTIGLYGRKFAVRVHMTDLRALRKIRGVLGGSIRKCKVPPNHKAAWEWSIVDRKSVARALGALLPFLTTKRQEAQAVLSFLRTRPTHRGVPYSPKEREAMVKLYWRLRNLKAGKR